jgi:hypothetical protein
MTAGRLCSLAAAAVLLDGLAPDPDRAARLV